jgi:hypothetical protein
VFEFPALIFEAESMLVVTTEAAGGAASDQLQIH